MISNELKNIISSKISDYETYFCSFIQDSKKIREHIGSISDNKKCFRVLVQYMHRMNVLVNYATLMKLISNNNRWEYFNKKLIDHNNDIQNDQMFHKKIKILANYHNDAKTDMQSKYLDNFIDSYFYYSCVPDLHRRVINAESGIIKSMNNFPYVKINVKYLNKKIPKNYKIENGIATIELTQENYINLLENIESPKIRHKIESHFLSRTKNVIPYFRELLVLRQEFALVKKSNTYFDLINKSQKSKKDILDFLDKVDDKLNLTIRSEIEMIYNHYKNSDNYKDEKITTGDIIRYTKLNSNGTKFPLKHIIFVIFFIYKKYFGLELTLATNIKLWRKDVISYKMTSGDKQIGTLILDLMLNDGKSIDSPISIKLSDAIDDGVHSNDTVIVLLANYSHDYDLDFYDSISLFKEFGHVLQNISYGCPFGKLNYDDEFSELFSMIFEFFAWDPDIINMIIEKKDPLISEHILLEQKFDLIYSLKLKCIFSKYDHIIHNSPQFIEAINTPGSNSEKIIVQLYNDIFNKTMKTISDLLSLPYPYLPPNLIVQEINNFQGVYYSSITTNIFAYSLYWLITNDNNDLFNNTILFNGNDYYGKLISDILSKTNIDCFTLYLSNYLEIVNASDDSVEYLNNFDENCFDNDLIIDNC
jgi:hypothetical protein